MVVIISYAVHCIHVTHVMIGNRHCMCTLRLLCLASETYWPAFVVILCSDPGIGVQCCAHIMVSSAVTKGNISLCMYVHQGFSHDVKLSIQESPFSSVYTQDPFFAGSSILSESLVHTCR